MHIIFNMWTVRNMWTKTSHHHIKPSHMNTRNKWKPIKGENRDFVIVVMQRQAPTPLLHLIFYSLQPSEGCYLDFFARYNLHGSSNSHIFFASFNPLEAPTSTSFNLMFINPLLERRLQSPDANKKQ